MAEDSKEIVGFQYDCVGIIDDDALVHCRVTNCPYRAVTIWQCTNREPREEFNLCHHCWQNIFYPTLKKNVLGAQQRKASAPAPSLASVPAPSYASAPAPSYASAPAPKSARRKDVITAQEQKDQSKSAAPQRRKENRNESGGKVPASIPTNKENPEFPKTTADGGQANNNNSNSKKHSNKNSNSSMSASQQQPQRSAVATKKDATGATLQKQLRVGRGGGTVAQQPHGPQAAAVQQQQADTSGLPLVSSLLLGSLADVPLRVVSAADLQDPKDHWKNEVEKLTKALQNLEREVDVLSEKVKVEFALRKEVEAELNSLRNQSKKEVAEIAAPLGRPAAAAAAAASSLANACAGATVALGQASIKLINPKAASINYDIAAQMIAFESFTGTACITPSEVLDTEGLEPSRVYVHGYIVINDMGMEEETGNWVEIDTKDVEKSTYHDLMTDAEAAPIDGAEVTVRGSSLRFTTKGLGTTTPTYEKCGADVCVNLQNFTGTLHFCPSS